MTSNNDDVPSAARNTLLRKRADIAGRVSNLQRQLIDLRADLLHIDHTLRLLDPEYQPQMRQPRFRAKFSTAGIFDRGELTRRIYDGLRRSGTISASELADTAMAEKKLTDHRARNYFVSRFLSRLAGLAEQGKLVRIHEGFNVRWTLASGAP